jgi:hypothetical protein
VKPYILADIAISEEISGFIFKLGGQFHLQKVGGCKKRVFGNRGLEGTSSRDGITKNMRPSKYPLEERKHCVKQWLKAGQCGIMGSEEGRGKDRVPFRQTTRCHYLQHNDLDTRHRRKIKSLTIIFPRIYSQRPIFDVEAAKMYLYIHKHLFIDVHALA